MLPLRHVLDNGTVCKSPALGDHKHCFFHLRLHQRPKRRDDGSVYLILHDLTCVEASRSPSPTSFTPPTTDSSTPKPPTLSTGDSAWRSPRFASKPAKRNANPRNPNPAAASLPSPISSITVTLTIRNVAQAFLPVQSPHHQSCPLLHHPSCRGGHHRSPNPRHPEAQRSGAEGSLHSCPNHQPNLAH